MHKECPAVVWGILLVRPYLENSWFTVRTDHEALKRLMMMSGAYEKRARWRLRLWEFEFDIVHRAGIKHQETDTLSRLPTKDTKTRPLDEKDPIFVLTGEPFAQILKPLKQHEDENVTNKQTIDATVPFLLEVVALADKVRGFDTDVSELAKFKQHFARHKQCYQITIIVSEPSTSLS